MQRQLPQPRPPPTPTATETSTFTPTLTPTETPTELSLDLEAESSLLSGGVETLEAAYYWYDGDGRDLCTPEPRSGERGNMVKSEINGVVTYYVGKHYEKQVDGVTEALHKYYTARTNRLAMRAPQGRSASKRKALLLGCSQTTLVLPGSQD